MLIRVDGSVFLDKPDQPIKESILVKRLAEEFGLVSAYHHLTASDGRFEEPTFYMYGHETRPYHLDYCFIPKDWHLNLRHAGIGNHADWKDSDHRPPVVELSA